MIVSVDVGFKGGIVFWRYDVCVKDYIIDVYYKMPIITKKVGKKVKKELDVQKLNELLSFASKVVIEAVHAMPKQGVTSVFNFGHQLGIITGLSVACCGVDNVFFITPQKWKKYFGLIKKPKSASVDLVNSLYLLQLKKSEDGISDSILIGKYFIDFVLKSNE